MVRAEVCVESVEGALAAERGGAHRLELCAHLDAGGLTPSLGLIQRVREVSSLDVMVMIRPRAGDFLYSASEIDVMIEDIDHAKNLGVRGVVFGVLNAEGDVDADLTARLIDRARPLEVTFHRAFDMTRDPKSALDALLDLSVDRLLSSGHEPDVDRGLPCLCELVRRAGTQMTVMPGGGVREDNIRELLEQTSAREVHFSASSTAESAMGFRHPRVTMSDGDDFELRITDEGRVRRMISLIGEG